MPDTPDLTALLGARICHDLISPLGAIGNGVELLMMTGAAVSPEIALIAESVANAHARIRYFRVAFGIASAEQRMGRPEITSILSDISKGGRLVYDWAVPGDLPRREVKLAFLLLQCCETAMPYGGRISVSRDKGQWHLHATAQRMKIDAGLWEELSNPRAAPAISAAQVQFLLVPEEARRQGRRLVSEVRSDTTRSDIILQF